MKRCKNGTKQNKKIGLGCYTKKEIEEYKQNKRTKRIESKIKGKIVTKRRIKRSIQLEIMEDILPKKKKYNEEFIEVLDKLHNIMIKQGEPFRAKAYQKAQESIMIYEDDIYSTDQLKDKPGIGSTITDKLNEYVKTGTLSILEKEKTNPINMLTDIYGVGPKKAKELVNKGIKTIDELRERQNEVLNDVQKVGLKYYEELLERIPRHEIDEYNSIFKEYFNKALKENDVKENDFIEYEIVGSYRRGAKTSGDIDVIITSKTGLIYKTFIDELIKAGIIVEVLSRGQSKTLVIGKMPGTSVARRIDFLYTPPDEFAFAILYFTGSKTFNTIMRQYGLNMGYTFNEHGIYSLENNKKGQKISKEFKKEKDIFDFLGLQYKTPIERVDGRAVVPYMNVGENITNVVKTSPTLQMSVEKIKKNKTLKKIKTKPKVILIEETEETEEKEEKEILYIIAQFKHTGISILDNLSETQLSDIITIANAKYYNQTPVMTDNQFDIVKEFIDNKFPNNSTIAEIGAKVERNKVKLPYEMASMDKIKPDTTALKTWMSKYTGPYVLSCKLDGVSGMYTTEGTSPKLYTRGNGKVGQDVSHLIPFIRLPKTKGIVIRGEFIIPKLIFQEKYTTLFANPRNMVAGIVNQKHISDNIEDLHFVAYEVIIPEFKPSEQMEYLDTINIEHVLCEKTDTLSNEILSNFLVGLRKTYIYEIDGIIVTNDEIYPRKSGNPEHAFAFKMVLSEQIAEAKVVDVIWTPSKDGYLKPRVQIEPLKLGGVTIEFATGFNGAFIKDNKIGIGATIEIIRSGDVIPHIKSVTLPAEEPKMPDVPFKWNDSRVDVMLENILDDPIVKEKNITGFFKGIGVDGLSSGNISRLIKSGFSDIPKIIKMNESEFLIVDGFKGKLANKIYTGIKTKLDEASIITLMSASNIFGRGFSDKKIETIIDELPDILVSDLSNSDKIKEVASIKGMSFKTAEAFTNKIDEFKEFLIECGLQDKLYTNIGDNKTKNFDQTHPLFDKNIVLTGTRDSNIIEVLKKVGAKQATSVSKNTFLVVAKNKNDETGKVSDAKELNIPVMSVEEFIETYL